MQKPKARQLPTISSGEANPENAKAANCQTVTVGGYFVYSVFMTISAACFSRSMYSAARGYFVPL